MSTENKAETAKRILTTSLELFTRHGIQFVTMDMIARELGMSKKTLYVHYRKKKELLQACIERRIVEGRTKQRAIMDSASNVVEGMITTMLDSSRELARVNPIFFEEISRYYPTVFRLVQKNRKEDNYQDTVRNLEVGVREGYFEESIDIDIVTKLFLAQIQLISDHDLFPVSEYPRATLIRHVFVRFLKGIATDRGREVIDRLIDQNEPLRS